ncbi:MAG: hypothetical protein R2876_04330 [Eubacteriales bacterium]
MHVYEAEETINQYIYALGIGTNGGIVRPISLLKSSSKQLVLSAYKIYMAYMIKHPILEKEQFKELMKCLLFINQFVPDREAKRINKIHQKRLAKKRVSSLDKKFYDDFIELYATNQVDSFKLHDEVGDYINRLNPLDHNSPYYCVTAYKLANVKYKPEYEVDFSSKLFK